jgi:hypothetical protein
MAANPIASCLDLQSMQYDLAGEYELVTDIDCTGINFSPIGSTAVPFMGKLDGKGHKISNLFIDKRNDNSVGLFSATYKQAKIQNLILENIEILGAGRVGGLIGVALNTTISNIKIQGKITGTGEYVGGIVASTQLTTINNSNVDGIVKGLSFVGGLAGSLWGTVNNSYTNTRVTGRIVVGGLIGRVTGEINNSYATGDVDGNSYPDYYTSNSIGGLVGDTISGAINNSYATGKVDGEAKVGGLAGQASIQIANSYATGNVNGKSYVGGLIGTYYASKASINNSYANGVVIGETYIGGLVGKTSGVITNSYATGNVRGKSSVGGLIGFSQTTINNCYAVGKVEAEKIFGGLIGDGSFPTTINSYWDIQTSEQSISVGGEGKSTSEMFQSNNYQGWDFIKIWNIKEGEVYPTLYKIP